MASSDNIKRIIYRAGWDNFQNIYASLADDWAVYDNSEDQPLLIEWSEKHDSK